MELKLLDLFSGIAGFSYAAEKIVGGYKKKTHIANL
jgi:site-specific DNA-cytosine methylase